MEGTPRRRKTRWRRRLALTGVLLALAWIALMGACAGQSESKDPRVREFERVAQGLAEMERLARLGDAQASEDAFWRVHDFFHEIDVELRREDPGLGQALWDIIVAIELELERGRDTGRLAGFASDTADLLRRAAAAMAVPWKGE